MQNVSDKQQIREKLGDFVEILVSFWVFLGLLGFWEDTPHIICHMLEKISNNFLLIAAFATSAAFC